jgi:hypothetical protein
VSTLDNLNFNPKCPLCEVHMVVIKPHTEDFNTLYGCKLCDVGYFVSDDEGPVTIASLSEYLAMFPVEAIAA